MRFIKYLFRWQVSGAVMMIPCALLNMHGVNNIYANIAIASVFGGAVFYKIDKHLIWREE